MYEQFPDRKVTILGLGYVGLTLAVAMAEIGFKVHGIEIRDEVLELLKKKQTHFWEKGLEERLAEVVDNGNFTFSRTMPEDGGGASIFMITVGTPLGDDGMVELKMIRNAASEVASVLPDGALVILRSTVKVGTARNIVAPILDACGRKYELAVCPERTLEGKALEELRQIPQVIGTDSPQTASRAAQLFGFITPTTLRVTSLETAEMVKLVDNTYRDVSFAFGNEVARICNVVGVNAREVIHAGSLGYARTSVAQPGPVGGPCLEKDPHILSQSARSFGLETPLVQAARLINETQPREVCTFLREVAALYDEFPRRPVISLLGLAFKGRPETDDLRGTMAKPMLHALAEAFPGATFRGYDPVVAPEQIGAFGVTPVLTVDDALHGANIAVIMNNHPVFSSFRVENLAGLLARPGVIYDFWGCQTPDDAKLPPDVHYVSLGDHARLLRRIDRINQENGKVLT